MGKISDLIGPIGGQTKNTQTSSGGKIATLLSTVKNNPTVSVTQNQPKKISTSSPSIISSAPQIISGIAKGINIGKLIITASTRQPTQPQIDVSKVQLPTPQPQATPQKTISITPNQKILTPQQLKVVAPQPVSGQSATMKQAKPGSPTVISRAAAVVPQTTAQVKDTATTVKEFIKSPSRFKSKATYDANNTTGLVEDLVTRKVTDFLHLPREAPAMIKSAIDAVSGAVGQGISLAIQERLNPPKTAGELVGLKAKQITNAITIGLSPINALFAAADKTPYVSELMRAVTIPFLAAGEITTKASDKIIDSLPISPQAKNNIKGPIGELAALTAQIVLGHSLAKISGKGMGKLNEASKTAFTTLTKDIIETNGGKGTVSFTPADVVKSVQGSVEKPYLAELRKIVNETTNAATEKVGIDPKTGNFAAPSGGAGGDVWTKAIKEGITIELPFEKVIGMVDKPWWGKIKRFLNAEVTDTTTTTQVPGRIVGPATEGAAPAVSIEKKITALLPENINHNPQAVINAVIKGGLEKTPEGKALVKSALEAQQAGTDLVIKLDMKGLDAETNAKIEALNVQDANNPVAEGNVRVYQSVGPGMTTDFVFKTPEELARFKNNVTAPEETFQYIDVKPEQITAVEGKKGVFKIATQDVGSSQSEQISSQIDKALQDIVEAKRLMADAPATVSPEDAYNKGIKSKADYQEYIDQTQKYIAKKEAQQNKVIDQVSTPPQDALRQVEIKPVDSQPAGSITDAKQALREAKGLSPEDIMKKYPDINLKKEVVGKDIYGQKIVIPEGEALTPYELKGNKVLLQDGETYIVSKNQYQNIKGNAVSGEAKDFAPELKGTEETVMGTDKLGEDTRFSIVEKNGAYYVRQNDIQSIVGTGYNDRAKTEQRLKDLQQANPIQVKDTTKYFSYQLPGGENYKEVLIKAPVEKGISQVSEWIKSPNGDLNATYNGKDLTITPEGSKFYVYEKGGQLGQSVDSLEQAKSVGEKWGNRQVKDPPAFRSSHWDEPNVISHLRLNERTYNGKKVTFLEELQSDWAREGRSNGFATEITKDTAKQQGFVVYKAKNTNGGESYFIDNPTDQYFYRKGFGSFGYDTEALAWEHIIDKLKATSKAIPNNPLLKNWQELSIKRALKEAVDNNSEYLAWINGEQTSARYNLAKQVKEVFWESTDLGKPITIVPKEGGTNISIRISKDGTIERSSAGDWKGKKLDEVLGKGLADKIMADEKGTLSGEGLKFGGEWANNLYDKQVKNIVEDLTGGKVETIDMGLAIGNEQKGWYVNGEGATRPPLTEADLKVGQSINGQGGDYIITDILRDGKFKAVKKQNYETGYNMNPETFDIFTKKSAGQQAIRITPEIRAMVRGEAAPLKKASGATPFFEPKAPKVESVVEAPQPKEPEALSPTDLEAAKARLEAKVAASAEMDKIPTNTDAQAPVGTGELKKSKAYTRVFDLLKSEFQQEVSYNVLNLEKDAKNAVDFIAKDPKAAIRVGLGLEQPPEGQTETAISIALAEKAATEGDYALQSRLESSRSLRQTRRGQEIVSERGRFGDDSPHKYMRELLNKRLSNLGANVKDAIAETMKRATSVKEAAMEKIDTEAKKIKEAIKRDRKKIQMAQDIINSLICK